MTQSEKNKIRFRGVLLPFFHLFFINAILFYIFVFIRAQYSNHALDFLCFAFLSYNYIAR